MSIMSAERMEESGLEAGENAPVCFEGSDIVVGDAAVQVASNVLDVLRLLAVDVARQVEVEVIFLDLRTAHQAGVFGDIELPSEDIDDLVDVSRITRGLISLRREPTEVSAVVAQAIESSRPVIDAKHHILTVSVPDESLRVNGDAARLSQIVGNILNNAAKFTDSGGRIDLIVKRDADDVMIQVVDNGVGISPEDVPETGNM